MAFVTDFTRDASEQYDWRIIGTRVVLTVICLGVVHLVIGAAALWAGFVTPYFIVSTLALLIAANIAIIASFIRSRPKS